MSETLEAAPATGEVQEDDFLKSLKQPTEKDSEPAPKVNPPKESKETEDPDDDDDDLDSLSNPALVTDILIETVDMVHNIAMQAISGEANPDMFKVPAQGKKRIKKATTKLIEKYNWQLHPGFALILLVLVVYGPTTVKAMAIRKQKVKAKKAKAGDIELDNVIEIKRSPGRPPGSTKDKK